jgi:hypothetical protein
LGAVRAVRGWTAGTGYQRAVRLAAAGALTGPLVAGCALTAERAGYPLFGFEPIVLRLTVAHFHYAALVAVLVTGLVARVARSSRQARAAALAAPAGVAVVMVGFFTDDAVELLGATVLTAAMWLAGLAVLRDVRPRVIDPVTRALLLVAAVVPVLTMTLAISWALGEATGLPHLPIGWMIATHGVAGALGFAGCAVLAWSRLRRSPAGRQAAAPAVPGERAVTG